MLQLHTRNLKDGQNITVRIGEPRAKASTQFRDATIIGLKAYFRHIILLEFDTLVDQLINLGFHIAHQPGGLCLPGGFVPRTGIQGKDGAVSASIGYAAPLTHIHHDWQPQHILVKIAGTIHVSHRNCCPNP
jgi:hypothetical protein